mgnify:CR=1 FL=1
MRAMYQQTHEDNVILDAEIQNMYGSAMARIAIEYQKAFT